MEVQSPFYLVVFLSVESWWYIWKYNHSFKIVFGLLGINTTPWSLFELSPSLSWSSSQRVIQSHLCFLLALLFDEETLLGTPLNSLQCLLSNLIFWDAASYLSDALTKGLEPYPQPQPYLTGGPASSLYLEDLSLKWFAFRGDRNFWTH